MYPERHTSLAIDLKVAQTLCYTSSYSEIDGMGENHIFLKVFIKLHTFGQPLLTPLYLPRTHFLPWVSLAWQHARLRWPGAAPPAWTAGWRASPSASVPPRVQSLCLAGTGTQSMWSGNEKKSHFFFLMCFQSNRSKSSQNICLQQKLAIFLYIHETQSWLSLWKKLKAKFERTQSWSHLPLTVPAAHHASQKPRVSAWRRIRPTAGSHVCSRGYRRAHWSHWAAVCLDASQHQNATILWAATRAGICVTLHAAGSAGCGAGWGLPYTGTCCPHTSAQCHSQPGVPGACVQQKITLPAPSLCSSALLSLYFYLLSI